MTWGLARQLSLMPHVARWWLGAGCAHEFNTCGCFFFAFRCASCNECLALYSGPPFLHLVLHRFVQ